MALLLVKHLLVHLQWGQMEKLINKHIMKIMLDNIEMDKLYHKNNKHIKIIMELIELHNKECLMIEAIK